MRIGLITTEATNIGDDLIRLGIVRSLRNAFGPVELAVLNKHDPLTVYPAGHPVRVARVLPIAKRLGGNVAARIAAPFGHSIFDDCEMIIQCGGPVLWPDCRRNEWAHPLWYGVLNRLEKCVPILNLAAGACYPWERQPSSLVSSRDRAYLSQVGRTCRLTTVRDKLAQDLMASIGISSLLIPCAALLSAATVPKRRPQENGHVLISYMLGAGHYDWDQSIDPNLWEQVVIELIQRIRKRHSVAFLCHNAAEVSLAAALDPSLPRLVPRSAADYAATIASSKAAICNRMHAAVALASSGIPSIAVGTDSRMLMVGAIGLPTAYAKECTAALLESQVEDLIRDRNLERERLSALRASTLDQYTAALRLSAERRDPARLPQ